MVDREESAFEVCSKLHSVELSVRAIICDYSGFPCIHSFLGNLQFLSIRVITRRIVLVSYYSNTDGQTHAFEASAKFFLSGMWQRRFFKSSSEQNSGAES
jgi:hypothetical protein